MSRAPITAYTVMTRAFEALGAACDAALVAAAAASGERFEPPPPVSPARDPRHAMRRVAYLAGQLADALFEYRVATNLPDMDPYDDVEHDVEDDDVSPF